MDAVRDFLVGSGRNMGRGSGGGSGVPGADVEGRNGARQEEGGGDERDEDTIADRGRETEIPGGGCEVGSEEVLIGLEARRHGAEEHHGGEAAATRGPSTTAPPPSTNSHGGEGTIPGYKGRSLTSRNGRRNDGR